MISSSGTHPKSGPLATKASSTLSSKNFKEFPRTRKSITTTTALSTYLPQSFPIHTCLHSEYSPITFPELHPLYHPSSPMSTHARQRTVYQNVIAAGRQAIRRNSARRKSTGILGSADCGNRGILARKHHLGRICCGHL